jgi:EF hand domain-containing protein
MKLNATAWNMTEREGDILSEGKAAPFIVNFKMVDTDRDGWITQDEFKQGCKNGWVQEKSAEGSQKPTGTEPPQAPPKVPKE